MKIYYVDKVIHNIQNNIPYNHVLTFDENGNFIILVRDKSVMVTFFKSIVTNVFNVDDNFIIKFYNLYGFVVNRTTPYTIIESYESYKDFINTNIEEVL